MNLKLERSMLNGKWQKVNGKFIKSIGHFAYDGCHKIYILESGEDVEKAMRYGYYLYPIETLRKTYEKSCSLKFIENMSLSTQYVQQFETPKWSEVKVSKKEMDKWLKEHHI